ncbi:MAG: hypothetical protein SFV18_05945 [Bryobacteraceae bacterium]|nr:hypothetical protein [Bryobacteraceae bacterium]
MSRVSYFQRFSQPENHATNNTLLVLRYFYQSSPSKVRQVLTSLLNTELSIGLTFEQQVRGKASVPDALISQEPLRIYVETKRGGELDADQIRRHLIGIETGSKNFTVLIGLTTEPISDSDRKNLEDEARYRNIAFAGVTFTQVVDALRGVCGDFEQELLSIVEDYESYLAEENLLEERNHRLVIFPCGQTVADNRRLNLYYEKADKPCKRNRFIGVYHNKAVIFVGRVEAIAKASWPYEFDAEFGTLTDDHKRRIEDAFKSTPYETLKTMPQRFYLVDSFEPTNATKITPGGIQGFRYLNLSKLVSSYDPRKDYATAQLAELLKGSAWE